MATTKDDNIAYSDEYQNYRKTFDYIFDTQPESVEKYTLGDDEYFVEDVVFSSVKNQNLWTKKSIIKDKLNEIILESKAIDDHSVIELIKHKNGKKYIIFNIDLYGYSVFDIEDNKIIHYIPEESFKNGETFIWTKVYYCDVNNLLVVEGCYWGCSYGLFFFDFTDPINLPLKCYGNTYDFETDFNISIHGDCEFNCFNEKGECVMNTIDDNTNTRTIDVINYRLVS